MDEKKCFEWIQENKGKYDREKVIKVLDVWGINNGYEMMDGSDFLWLLENSVENGWEGYHESLNQQTTSSSEH